MKNEDFLKEKDKEIEDLKNKKMIALKGWEKDVQMQKSDFTEFLKDLKANLETVQRMLNKKISFLEGGSEGKEK